MNAAENTRGHFLSGGATPETVTGVGDFAKIWEGLEDVYPCVTNYSPQVAFIDDGIVVPGTGGGPVSALPHPRDSGRFVRGALAVGKCQIILGL